MTRLLHRVVLASALWRGRCWDGSRRGAWVAWRLAGELLAVSSC